ncbi:MAG: aromatic ring-hydroxylating dioxygenase subunit alpha [Ilumatobacteraceae bacterium]|nr:aromatic ring-hydroxylating dioxygenase subunit alpha [Ilumatobacteraceae bacterium]
MSRQELVRMAQRAIDAHAEGKGEIVDDILRVPVEHYFDQERWQKEVDRIFKRLPLVLGFTCQMREPGSYSAVTILDVPVLMVRGQDGSMRAFLNVCSHRGAQLTDDGCGTARRFTCPYHAWSYDTAGDLVGIYEADAFGDIDKSCNGLTTLPVTERAGIIWVTLTPNSTLDHDSFFHGYDEVLEHHHFENCYYAGQQSIDGANWKVCYDGYLDFYHLPILHKNSFGPDLSPKALFEAWGPHQRLLAPDKRQVGPLDGVPVAEWPTEKLVFGVWTIFPHISIASFEAEGRIYMISQLFPGATPEESVTVQHFLHCETQNPERDASVADRMKFMRFVVEEEDYKTGLQIQRGLKSGAKKEVMFGRNEGGTQAFHKWVQALIDTDDEDLSALFAKGVGAKSN